MRGHLKTRVPTTVHINPSPAQSPAHSPSHSPSSGDAAFADSMRGAPMKATKLSASTSPPKSAPVASPRAALNPTALRALPSTPPPSALRKSAPKSPEPSSATTPASPESGKTGSESPVIDKAAEDAIYGQLKPASRNMPQKSNLASRSHSGAGTTTSKVTFGEFSDTVGSASPFNHARGAATLRTRGKHDGIEALLRSHSEPEKGPGALLGNLILLFQYQENQ